MAAFLGEPKYVKAARRPQALDCFYLEAAHG